MTSTEPLKRLVKLVARAFYDDVKPAVVVLDALARRGQWVREESLARDLKLQSKQLRQCLYYLENEKLIVRAKRNNSGAHASSYCCIDYGRIYDVVRYRLHHMRKKLKGDAAAVQEYVCLNCTKRYSDFDAMSLVSFESGSFHCESCNHELVKATAVREDSKKMLERMNVQLKPLMEQLNRIEHLDFPEFATLQDWGAELSTDSSQGYREIQVEVFMSQDDDVQDENTQSEAKRQKVQVPWMSSSLPTRETKNDSKTD